MNSSANPRTYYPFLDGFRALAILWVIIHHLNYSFHIALFFPDALSRNLDRFADIGNLGVDIFFVISGFLISGLLLEDLDSRLRVRRFYFRRFFKIIPQYLLTVLAGIVLTRIFFDQRKELVSVAASYLLLLQNYASPITFLSHLWSIAVEEHFYFLYPLLLQGVCGLIKDRQRRRPVVLAILLVLMLAVFLVRCWTFIHFPYSPKLLFQMTHLRIDALLMGCVIKLTEPFWAGLAVSRWRFLSGGCCLASGGLFYLLFLRFDPCRSMHYVGAYLASGFLLVSALIGFRPLLAVTQNAVMRWVGRNSYATYLWHYPLIVVFGELLHGKANVLTVLAIAILTILAGALSTMTVERYFLDLRKKIVP